MSEGPAASDRCPRCAAAFVCGAAGPAPCDCTQLALSEALQADLRRQYVGCLCLACLRELASAEAQSTPANSRAGID